MEALDHIEKRIDNLTRLLGTLPNDESASPANAETLTDSLLSATTLLTSATSGRDTINDFVKRAPEIERYLDPDFIEQQQDARAKEAYLQMVAPDLCENFQQLEDIKKLEPTLGAEYFRAMPNVTDNLEKMNESMAEMAQKNELLEETLTLAMQRYDEIQTSLRESLRSMNDRITRMEQKMQQKKTLNEDV